MDLSESFDQVDRRLTAWMARYAVPLLRVALGVVFLWFGILKFVAGMSPAAGLVEDTWRALGAPVIAPATFVLVLAAWECAIGLGLISGRLLRLVILLLLLQMPGTLLPVVLFPERVFIEAPYALTLEGQYIVKNFVLVSAALVIGATVRGGQLRAEME